MGAVLVAGGELYLRVRLNPIVAQIGELATKVVKNSRSADRSRIIPTPNPKMLPPKVAKNDPVSSPLFPMEILDNRLLLPHTGVKVVM